MLSSCEFLFYAPVKGAGPWRPGTTCVPVRLPSACPTCGGALSVMVLGTPNEPGAFMSECSHMSKWEDFWSLIEPDDAPPTPRTHNIMHPTKCKHCHEPCPYVEPPPSGFTCYSCRSSGRK